MYMIATSPRNTKNGLRPHLRKALPCSASTLVSLACVMGYLSLLSRQLTNDLKTIQLSCALVFQPPNQRPLKSLRWSTHERPCRTSLATEETLEVECLTEPSSSLLWKYQVVLYKGSDNVVDIPADKPRTGYPPHEQVGGMRGVAMGDNENGQKQAYHRSDNEHVLGLSFIAAAEC